jgi:hypothetical protein
VSEEFKEKRSTPRRSLGVVKLWVEMRNVVTAELLLGEELGETPRSEAFARMKQCSSVGVIAAILVLAEMTAA